MFLKAITHKKIKAIWLIYVRKLFKKNCLNLTKLLIGNRDLWQDIKNTMLLWMLMFLYKYLRK